MATTDTQAAQKLFEQYATGYTPQQAGLDFWQNQINTLGEEAALQKFLNPDEGSTAGRLEAMYADPDYAQAKTSSTSSANTGSWSQDELQATKDFFATNPTPDQIYETAQSVGLTADQLADVYAQATGNDPSEALSSVNTYLQDTGKTLSGGYQPTASAASTTPVLSTQAQKQLQDFYKTTFGRDIDQAGLDYWSSVIGDTLDPDEINTIMENAGAKDLAYVAQQQAANAPVTTPTNTEAAQRMFNTYATGYSPEQAGLEFWQNQINTLGEKAALEKFLNPDPGSTGGRLETMYADPDYIRATSTQAPTAGTTYEGGTALEQLNNFYTSTFGRPLDQAGQDYWTNVIGSTLDPVEIKTILDNAGATDIEYIINNNPQLAEEYGLSLPGTPTGGWNEAQLDSAKTFFNSNPTGDQIYQVAKDLNLTSEQLASLYSSAMGSGYKQTLNDINAYLSDTGKQLGTGWIEPTVPEETTTTPVSGTALPAYSASGEGMSADVMKNVFTSPLDYIPTAATQTYTQQTVQPNELISTTTGQMGAVTPVTTPTDVTAPTLSAVPNMTADEVKQIEQIAAASYQAAMSGTAPEVTAATAEGPSNLITAAQGEITNLAQAAQGTMPVSALMSNQVEELLKVADGESVPNWALPALRAAENALAARGMGRSSVAREALMSSIVNAALPIAQQNAAAIQADYLANLNNRQQAAITNANNLAQMDLANLNANQQAQVENAKAFLATDLANLNNSQQANVINAQIRQQQMLSDQSATNAALQFNAANQAQTDQFMANLNSSIALNNAARNDAASQYNSQLAQQRAAIDAGNELAVAQFNAQMQQQVDQFNSQLNFNREQFNAQNALVVEQSNVNWRRQLNTQNTAGINAVNQANAMNAFNLSNQALTLLWQQTRDEANWAFQSAENAKQAQVSLAVAALGNEAATDAAKREQISSLASSAAQIFAST